MVFHFTRDLLYAVRQRSVGLDYGYGTVEKVTLSAADRRIKMSLMKILYSHGARN